MTIPDAGTTVETAAEKLGFVSDAILLGQQESVSVLPESREGESGDALTETKVEAPVTPVPPPVTDGTEVRVEKPDAKPEDSLSPGDKVEGEATEPKVEGEGEEVKVEEEGDLLSFDLPTDGGIATSGATQGTETSEGVAFDPESPLKESDPQWMHEAFQRLKGDEDVSPDDLKVIQAMSPSKWEQARTWNKSHKSLGQFRNPEYPIEQFAAQLEKQSAERAKSLRLTMIKDAVGDTASLKEFAEESPETYGDLIVALAQSRPDILVKILEKKGYSVQQGQKSTVDVEAITTMLQESDEWAMMAGTDIEAKIQELIQQTAKMVESSNEVVEIKPEDILTAKQDDEDAQADEQLSQKAQLASNIFEKWEQDIHQGVRSTGLAYPSDDEVKQKPVPSLLRRLAYNMSVHGLDGMLPNWRVALFDWGEKRDGFQSKVNELQDLIKQSRQEDATSYSRSIAADAHEFGRLRASIGAVKTLLKLADAEEKKLSDGTTVSATETLRADNTISSTGELGQPKQTGFFSDNLVLNQLRR